MYITNRHIIIIIMLGIGISIADGLGASSLFLIHAESQHDMQAKNRLLSWKNLIQDNMGESEWHKINAVNNFFNQIRFVSDEKHWNRKDYWATPVEFLTTYGGDCEDFSIAKYFTLLKLGIPDERLRITYVKAIQLNQAHMVLAYYEKDQSEAFILDNLNKKIHSSSSRNDLLPVYSFNREDLWFAKKEGHDQPIQGGSKQINLWRDLILRMNIKKYPT